MAQVLKESVRMKIVESAKKELLEKGYRDASMRSIAFHSGMTVGNLYRYYKNKDELVQMIVSPALRALNQVIQEKTQDRISLFEKASALGFSKEQIGAVLDSLADDLVDLFCQYKDEVLILFLDSEVQIHVRTWFSELIETLIHERYEESRMFLTETELISKMLASSIFSGVQECLRHSDSFQTTNASLKLMIRLYFRLYLSMLDFDLNKLAMEE